MSNYLTPSKCQRCGLEARTNLHHINCPRCGSYMEFIKQDWELLFEEGLNEIKLKRIL